jgi:hypothetical protein
VITPLDETDAGSNFGCGMLTVEGSAARPTGGLWIDLPVLDREGGMKWRVMIELAGAGGTVQLHGVSAGGSTAAECSVETLGLTLAEGKMTLAGLERHLVQAQAEEHRFWTVS